MNFFITGLPRTRTSWLSTLFTYRGAYCFHELGKYGKDFMQLKDVIETRVEPYVGTADSMAPYYFEALSETLRGFRLAIIKRDKEEAIQSFLKSFGYSENQKITDRFNDIEEKLNNLIYKYEPLVIDFKDLDDIQKVKELWYYCLPEMEFDEDRYRMLNDLKIEPYVNKYMENADISNVNSIVGV